MSAVHILLATPAIINIHKEIIALYTKNTAEIIGVQFYVAHSPVHLVLNILAKRGYFLHYWTLHNHDTQGPLCVYWLCIRYQFYCRKL